MWRPHTARTPYSAADSPTLHSMLLSHRSEVSQWIRFVRIPFGGRPLPCCNAPAGHRIRPPRCRRCHSRCSRLPGSSPALRTPSLSSSWLPQKAQRTGRCPAVARAWRGSGCSPEPAEPISRWVDSSKLMRMLWPSWLSCAVGSRPARRRIPGGESGRLGRLTAFTPTGSPVVGRSPAPSGGAQGRVW